MGHLVCVSCPSSGNIKSLKLGFNTLYSFKAIYLLCRNDSVINVKFPVECTIRCVQRRSRDLSIGLQAETMLCICVMALVLIVSLPPK